MDDERPVAMRTTSMTRMEYLETAQGCYQPVSPDEPTVRYEFSVDATEHAFRLLMGWLDAHGIHGTYRASRQANEQEEAASA